MTKLLPLLLTLFLSKGVYAEDILEIIRSYHYGSGVRVEVKAKYPMTIYCEAIGESGEILREGLVKVKLPYSFITFHIDNKDDYDYTRCTRVMKKHIV